MKPLAALCLALVLSAPAARADDAADIGATYLRFVEAQNARDPDRIRDFFVARPDFLWVSDGKSFWGPDDVIARMSSFQKAPVWRVEPDTDGARFVALNDDTALYHLRLTLVIGAEAQPAQLPFLVTIVFVRQDAAWKIAGLLTTSPKP